MKLGIFTPLHIKSIENIYMANYQYRFMKACDKIFDEVVPLMSIDRDETGKFNDMYIIELRGINDYGIVKPTLKAIEYFDAYDLDYILRITQDTHIIDFDEFVKLVNNLESPSLVGGYDICCDIQDYLKEINIYQKDTRYKFVQGNFILASKDLWEYYKKLPKSVKHYCDDSIFSYLIEHEAGIAPQFIDRWNYQNIWRHDNSKDIYYLESLFKD